MPSTPAVRATRLVRTRAQATARTAGSTTRLNRSSNRRAGSLAGGSPPASGGRACGRRSLAFPERPRAQDGDQATSNLISKRDPAQGEVRKPCSGASSARTRPRSSSAAPNRLSPASVAEEREALEWADEQDRSRGGRRDDIDAASLVGHLPGLRPECPRPRTPGGWYAVPRPSGLHRSALTHA